MIDESLYQISKLLDLTQSQLYFLEVKTWMPVQDPFSQKMITFLPIPVTRACSKLVINTSYSRWEGWITSSDLAAADGTTSLEHTINMERFAGLNFHVFRSF